MLTAEDKIGLCIRPLSVRQSSPQNIDFPENWDRQACANSADPDQTPQIAASDQGLHCLHS